MHTSWVLPHCGVLIPASISFRRLGKGKGRGCPSPLCRRWPQRERQRQAEGCWCRDSRSQGRPAHTGTEHPLLLKRVGGGLYMSCK